MTNFASKAACASHWRASMSMMASSSDTLNLGMGTSFVAAFNLVGADMVVVENKKEAKLAKFTHLYTHGNKFQTQQTSHEFQLAPCTTP